jgi:Flp pilus assembly protein TadB
MKATRPPMMASTTRTTTTIIAIRAGCELPLDLAPELVAADNRDPIEVLLPLVVDAAAFGIPVKPEAVDRLAQGHG